MFSAEFFTGKRALITGGAKRLGRETAHSLASAGVHMAIHYNSSKEPAEDLCGKVERMGVRGLALQANLNDPDSVEPLFEAAWEGLGGIDFVVNNASIFPSGRLEGLDLNQVVRNLRVNAWAPFLLTRAFWHRVRGTERRGSVVNLLDTRLVGGDLAHTGYHLSKAALAEFTTLTALEFGPELQVNAVAPGAVLPPEQLGEEHLERLTKDLPLRRRGYPKDIADATLYLLGASFVTGQVIFVDGGRHLRLGGTS